MKHLPIALAASFLACAGCAMGPAAPDGTAVLNPGDPGHGAPAIEATVSRTSIIVPQGGAESFVVEVTPSGGAGADGIQISATEVMEGVDVFHVGSSEDGHRAQFTVEAADGAPPEFGVIRIGIRDLSNLVEPYQLQISLRVIDGDGAFLELGVQTVAGGREADATFVAASSGNGWEVLQPLLQPGRYETTLVDEGEGVTLVVVCARPHEVYAGEFELEAHVRELRDTSEELVRCRLASGGARSVSGDVVGLVPTATALIALGQESTNGQTSYTMSQRAGHTTLLALEEDPALGFLRSLVRTIAATDDVTQDLDFTTASLVQSYPVTFTGDGERSGSVTAMAGGGFLYDDDLLEEGRWWDATTVDVGALAFATDTSFQFSAVSNADHLYRARVTDPATFAFAEVRAVGAGGARDFGVLTPPAANLAPDVTPDFEAVTVDGADAHVLSLRTNFPPHDWTVWSNDGSLQVPDLSGVPGWNAAWTLELTGPVFWTVEALPDDDTQTRHLALQPTLESFGQIQVDAWTGLLMP